MVSSPNQTTIRTGTYPKAVSNDQHCHTIKLVVDDPADLCICGGIDACSCLIQNENLLPLQEGPCKYNKLFLTG